MSRRRWPGTYALALLLALVAGCVPAEQLPVTCGDLSVSLQATLTGDHLEPATLDVCRGQAVTIRVAIERDGILHLHGYDDLLGAREVRAGQESTLAFDAIHIGQFPIALHTVEQPQELIVGTLTVHDA
jgi:hypothetical protein